MGLSILIHEFNHLYINHLLTSNRQALEQAGAYLYQITQWAMRSQAYGNWETMINESLVRAAVICYLFDKEENKEVAENEIIQQLQHNFYWMPELVQLFRKYQKHQRRYGTLENFYPQIVDFFNKYARQQQKRVKKVVETYS